MMSSIKTSELFNQRSFVSRKIEAIAFKAIGDGALVTKVVSKGDSKTHAVNLALIDLSVAARIGFRGTNAKSHLDVAKLPVPSKPNMMEQSKKGSLMTLRLSDNEYWVLDGSTEMGEKLHMLTALPVPYNCYRLYCQHSHAWFMLTGQYIEQTMAKICGVDLRKLSFPLDTIIQTSVAKVNAVIVRHEVNKIPVFSILSDSSSAAYLWDSLLDAMGEFDGCVLGIDALGLE
jgi:sarcosine oxidase subunit gamma